MNIVSFRGVRYCYGDVCAVQNVTFSIVKNTLVPLLGPNGGGKSTLIRLLSGLIRPEEGVIETARNMRIGYVSQNAQFDITFPITVKEFVLHGTLEKKLKPFYRYSTDDYVRALHALERVGLLKYEARGINQLSGGQLRRAMIARVIASGADIIVLDEPDSSLDIDAIGKLYEVLDSLREDKTIVVSSHHVSSILDIADKALYVNQTVKVYDKPEILKEKVENGILI